MIHRFDLQHDRLGEQPRFASMARALDELPCIDSASSFHHYCREACRLWRETSDGEATVASPQFAEHLSHIAQGGKSIIPTSWGGVVVSLHEPPCVEKFLVIKAGRNLALEKHEQKTEALEVREGAGLILWRHPNEERLTVEALEPGATFHLDPGQEHCLIGTENLLVFERSIDPKGMDQDLIFLFEPEEGEPADQQ